MTASVAALIPRMSQVCGARNVVTDPLELRTYECDGLTSHRATPALVVFPGTAEQVADVVRECARAGVPFVARGSGTGLSGGAVPREDGVLIVLAKMRAVLEVDPVARRAVVEPGVTNLAVTQAAAPYGLFYAPDPSSQLVCSVGGNVAENSGGAHCLKHGFTVNHVTGLEVVTPSGELTWLGDGTGVPAGPLGYDLLGAFTGSEGTLGIVTKIVVKLTPAPEAVHLVLAAYDTLDRRRSRGVGHHRRRHRARRDRDDGRPVDRGRRGCRRLRLPARTPARCSSSSSTGQPPRSRPNWPPSSKSVLAPPRSAPPTIPRNAPPYGRAASPRSPPSAAWRPPTSCRTASSPAPRLAEVLGRISDLSKASGIRVANVFHAGDGNLHPLVLYDDAVPGEAERAEEVSGAILDACIEYGGSITGEHGVGLDKARYMPKMFTADDLDTMQLLRCAFDPANLCNPGKIFPTPRLCGEVPGHRRAPVAGSRGPAAAGQPEIF